MGSSTMKETIVTFNRHMMKVSIPRGPTFLVDAEELAGTSLTVTVWAESSEAGKLNAFLRVKKTAKPKQQPWRTYLVAQSLLALHFVKIRDKYQKSGIELVGEPPIAPTPAKPMFSFTKGEGTIQISSVSRPRPAVKDWARK